MLQKCFKEASYKNMEINLRVFQKGVELVAYRQRPRITESRAAACTLLGSKLGPATASGTSS